MPIETVNGLNLGDYPGGDWRLEEPAEEREGVHRPPSYAPDSSLERLIKLALMEMLPDGSVVSHESRRNAQKEVVRVIESWLKREEDVWRSIETEGTLRVANTLETMRMNRLRANQ
jgi:hypothetical protein